MRRIRLSKEEGFTLVELMIVIAVIAILASIAIPQYLKYQRKAKVSSYALPLARACAMDMAAYCVENPGKTNVVVNATNTPNCPSDPYTNETAGGQVTVDPNSFSCTSDGSLENNNNLVTATLSGVNDYQVRCEFTNSSIRCTVEGK